MHGCNGDESMNLTLLKPKAGVLARGAHEDRAGGRGRGVLARGAREDRAGGRGEGDVGRPPAFADCHSRKFGSSPPTETGRQGPHLLRDSFQRHTSQNLDKVVPGLWNIYISEG